MLAMEGRIEVHSEGEGEGAKVDLYIPCALSGQG